MGHGRSVATNMFWAAVVIAMQRLIVVPHGSYPYITLAEKTLVKQCTVAAYMASGPGGQKRNRTYSAVRITHQPTGLSCIAEDSRSQAENRKRAISRLKKQIALTVRASPESDATVPPPT